MSRDHRYLLAHSERGRISHCSLIRGRARECSVDDAMMAPVGSRADRGTGIKPAVDPCCPSSLLSLLLSSSQSSQSNLPLPVSTPFTPQPQTLGKTLLTQAYQSTRGSQGSINPSTTSAGRLEMCYYDWYMYRCGDWKWGNFKQHCQAEYRTGETCGMKLMKHKIEMKEKCRLCDKLETKKRRRAAEIDRVQRWQKEGSKPASVDKSKDAIRTLEREIDDLTRERTSRLNKVGTRG